jgi:membrane protein YqaA with SNARE-associated domain
MRRYRVEIKFLLLSIFLLGSLFILAQNDVFGGLEDDVNHFMDNMSELGVVGVFIVALIANSSLLIQVPYTLPMLSVAVYTDDLPGLVILGIATGMGAGIGEIVSYAIASNIAAHIRELSKSSLFRWIRDTINRHPHLIPFFVFIGAAFPIPDDLIVMPLAVINYPIRKLMIPMFTGKILHNFTIAFVFHYATSQAKGMISRDVNVDLSLGILVIFILVIGYQVEKARVSIAENKLTGEDSETDIPLVKTTP